jgi:hypothetical protein
MNARNASIGLGGSMYSGGGGGKGKPSSIASSRGGIVRGACAVLYDTSSHVASLRRVTWSGALDCYNRRASRTRTLFQQAMQCQ